MNEINIENFKSIYEGGKASLIIDVRTPSEFLEAHVDGAVNLPLDQLTAAQVIDLQQKRNVETIYLICKSGGRSMRALQQLQADGINNTISIAGGTGAAIASGLKIIKSGQKAISLERQVRIVAGFLVFFGSLLGILVNSYWLALPLLVGAGLAFSGITDTCGMAMFLAKCPWNQKSAVNCCLTK